MSEDKSTYCQFCQILFKSRQSGSNLTSEIIESNEEFFAFYDLHKNSSVQHVLVCPTDHIEIATDIKDYSKFDRMIKFAENLLTKIAISRGIPITENMFRMGFHIPPNNSIFHVHMHCLILPITKPYFDKVVYGLLLKSVDQVIEKIQIQKRRHAKL